MPEARKLKCPKGHIWYTTKKEWYFLEFKDALGNTIWLKSCPMCFVQYMHKQVLDIKDEGVKDVQPVLDQVDQRTPSSGGVSGSPDAQGSPGPQGSGNVQTP